MLEKMGRKYSSDATRGWGRGAGHPQKGPFWCPPPCNSRNKTPLLSITKLTCVSVCRPPEKRLNSTTADLAGGGGLGW